MREIKFRAKRTDSLNNEWIYGSYMDSYFSSRFGLVTAIFFNDYEICKTFRIPVLKDTVGQFTGLKDKNGKEIYEGDILKTKYNKRDFIVWIKYDEEYAQFVTRCAEFILDEEPLGDLYESRMEVIGNVYENPELLKGANNIE